MNIGETKDINVKFPEEYHAELAGKDAVFTVTINEIKIKELPEADDEFAKDVSDFDTLAEYKADIAKRLAERADEEAEMKAENELLEKIVSASEAEAPQSMIEAEMDDMIKELEYRMMYQGLKLEDFLKYSGQTMEGLREERKGDAEKSVKTRLVIEKIIETENLQISAEEMEAKMQELAKAQNKSVEEYKKTADKNAFVRIMNRMLSEKFFNFLKENNKITIKE
jgi:trigger factor